MPDLTIAPFAPSVNMPSGLSGVWQLAGWHDFDEAIMPVLAVLGFAGGGSYDKVQESNGAQCYRIAPDKLWLRAENAALLSPALALATKDNRLTALDISHSRMAITLSGNGAESLMTKIAAANFAAFQTNTFTQTTIQGIGVLIHRTTSQSFTIYAPRTWHESIRDFLIINGANQCHN